MDQKEYIQLEGEYGGYQHSLLNVVLSRGEGVWVWDVAGNKYLDCDSAYSTVNQGHCHPKIIRSLIEQANNLTLAPHSFFNDQIFLLYGELCELTGYDKTVLLNSGTEAVETAINLVRRWGYKNKNVSLRQTEIIVCENNFHGHTITIFGFSSDHNLKESFGPFAPGFKVIPFGDTQALEDAISPNTVGFLVEPIQSEAGIILPPAGFLKEAKAICEKNMVPLILDEIQTGLGRTGTLLAAEHDGIKADLSLIGGSLCGGVYPVSAILSNNDILDELPIEEYGNTYCGNPLACSIARASIRVLIEEDMIKNSAKMGAYFVNELKKIKSSKINEIRAKGLMIGLELSSEVYDARQYYEKLKDKGLLCRANKHNVIYFTPPLIIKKKEINWALERINTILN